MDEKPEVPAELRDRLLQVLDEAMRVGNAACGKIRIFDGKTLKIEAHRGLSDGFVETFETIKPDDELASARAARTRRRVSIPDLAHDPLSKPYAEAGREEGFKAMQSTPIVASDGRVLGTLSTHFPGLHQTSIAAGLVLDFCADKAATLIERFLAA